MRVSGVWLPDRGLIWADAGDLQIHTLDFVAVRLQDREDTQGVPGQVYVTPEQLVGVPPEVSGVIVRTIQKAPAEKDWRSLPGSTMPPLATQVHTRDGDGQVTSIDPLAETVTFTTESGENFTVSLVDVE